MKNKTKTKEKEKPCPLSSPLVVGQTCSFDFALIFYLLRRTMTCCSLVISRKNMIGNKSFVTK
jgi:hypothetical protein